MGESEVFRISERLASSADMPQPQRKAMIGWASTAPQPGQHAESENRTHPEYVAPSTVQPRSSVYKNEFTVDIYFEDCDHSIGRQQERQVTKRMIQRALKYGRKLLLCHREKRIKYILNYLQVITVRRGSTETIITVIDKSSKSKGTGTWRSTSRTDAPDVAVGRRERSLSHAVPDRDAPPRVQAGASRSTGRAAANSRCVLDATYEYSANDVAAGLRGRSLSSVELQQAGATDESAKWKAKAEAEATGRSAQCYP